MTTTYGLTSTGFVTPTAAQIQADMEADFRAEFGQTVDLSPESVFGQLVGIMTERFALLWQLAEAIYTNNTPDGASGVALDLLAGITGSVRRPASLSKVTATFFGTSGTVIPSGTIVSVAGTGAKFQTLANAAIGLSGQVDIACAALDAGAVVASAGTLTVVETPIAGLNTVSNAADARTGDPVESDATFRVRREQELHADGNAAVEAVRQAVLKVSGVIDCKVFENVTDAADVDGVPAHGIEVLVSGGVAADIAAAIFASRGAGVATSGNQTAVVVTDSMGNPHSIKWSRPTTINAYIAATIAQTAAYPGHAAAKAALAAWGQANLRAGAQLNASAIVAQLFAVGGVTDAAPVYIGAAPSPTTTAAIVPTSRQQVVLDTSRITINGS